MSTPNPRRANGYRRDKLTARVYREEDLCGICSQPVDKTIPYIDPDTSKPHPWAKSIDEIIPISLGGSALERANVRLAHRICNIRRGDGTRSAIESVKRVRAY